MAHPQVEERVGFECLEILQSVERCAVRTDRRVATEEAAYCRRQYRQTGRIKRRAAFGVQRSRAHCYSALVRHAMQKERHTHTRA